MSSAMYGEMAKLFEIYFGTYLFQGVNTYEIRDTALQVFRPYNVKELKRYLCEPQFQTLLMSGIEPLQHQRHIVDIVVYIYSLRIHLSFHSPHIVHKLVDFLSDLHELSSVKTNINSLILFYSNKPGYQLVSHKCCYNYTIMD